MAMHTNTSTGGIPLPGVSSLKIRSAYALDAMTNPIANFRVTLGSRAPWRAHIRVMSGVETTPTSGITGYQPRGRELPTEHFQIHAIRDKYRHRRESLQQDSVVQNTDDP
ncbi:hypothetical protein [Rhodococcus sp. 4CII]|uniref:hypothetical protein n=1 Tax=Rhodococcus sp. 4CII TaxID=2834580 RepID=UPI0020787CC9|nr:MULTISPECIES: hypothetical protein [unclassified Rhodococcus (in: high G+C Gram-positive bacteria)]